MSINFCIIVPTNARPYCLERLLQSSRATLHIAPQRILVGNSTAPDAPDWVHHWYDKLGNTPGIDVIRLAPNQSPASSRKALVAKCSSEYIMMLDDDHVITASSNLLLQTIAASNWDIVGGIWLQDKNSDYRHLITENDARSVIIDKLPVPSVESVCFGWTYSFSRGRDPGLIIKTPVKGSPRLKYLLEFDNLMPSTLVRREVFDKINFDERFMYFFEWFDFYLQAKHAGVKCATHTGAHFLHLPERYAYKSAAQLNPREEDRERFLQKWGLIPLFSGEMPPHQAT